MTASGIIQAVNDFLNSMNLNFSFHSDQNVITFRVGIQCKLKNVQYAIALHESYYTVYVTCPISAEEGYRNEIAKYITMANYGLNFGCFELDYRDGEIRYKLSIVCDDLDRLPEQIIALSVSAPIKMYERYGNGLAALLMGFSDAETEIKKAETEK